MKTLQINKINDDIKTEWLLQYLLCLNIPISYYRYLKSNDNWLMLDLLGTTILSVNNYKFHNNLYLNHKNNDSLEMKPFIYDHISIRVRVALSLTSYCLIHNEFYNVLYACIMNHIASSIAALYYTKNVSIIEFNEKNNLKSLLINWLYINITIESMLIGYMQNSLLNLYIIALLIGIVYKYKVFYNYTHVAFHVLLIIQNYIA
jgi:hypothetical protein